jgi:hypothetical protein
MSIDKCHGVGQIEGDLHPNPSPKGRKERPQISEIWETSEILSTIDFRSLGDFGSLGIYDNIAP